MFDNSEIYVPDTSAVIEGVILKIVEKAEYPEIIVPEAVLCELEHQANSNEPKGLKGLKTLQKLQNSECSVSFKGKRPTNYDIKNAKNGEIDAIIRDIAKSELATLITCDKIQAEVAKAQGIPIKYIKQSIIKKELSIASLFDETTMSIHLKEDVVAMAKKGQPGDVKLVEIGSKPLTYEELNNIANEIIEKERNDPKTYLESNKEGSIVIQSGEYRISIAKTPFAEAFEITIVKPVANVDLFDYKLSEKLINRLTTDAEGILVSGSPGAGKSTFVQALAKFYSENKIVKTMESPRDLQLPNEITQYSPLEGTMENTADVLLLVRPDFTIYDELRKNSDFNIFADMRMAGVGMIGVVHATKAIDAIQRIASRVELGVIPSIVDTNIYIENGEIKKVYETKMTVKVPTGMQEADLARPVIEIRDFETGELKNEIYTYGEQTIVMDVGLVEKDKHEESSAVNKIAEKELKKRLKKIIGNNVEVEIVSPDRANIYVAEKLIPSIIGKNGKRIAEIEKKVGISLGVETKQKDHIPKGKIFKITAFETSKHIILDIGRSGSNYDVFIENEYLLTATTSRQGEIKIKKGIELAEIIQEAIHYNLIITACEK